MHVFELEEFKHKCFNCKEKWTFLDKYSGYKNFYCNYCTAYLYINCYTNDGNIYFIILKANKTEIKINFILNSLRFWRIDSDGRSKFHELSYKLFNINDFILDYNSAVNRVKKILVLVE